MSIKKIHIIHYILAVFTILLVPFSAQSTDIKTIVKPIQITLGDAIQFDIIVNYNPLIEKINLPKIPKVFNGFEIIDQTIDTVENRDNTTLTLQTRCTHFDEGNYYIPSFLIESINLANGESVLHKTDSFKIAVQTVQIDTTKDIKPLADIIQVPMPMSLMLKYIAISLLVLSVLLVCIWFLIKYIRKKKSISKPVPYISPYDKAIQSIKDLSTKVSADSDKTKTLYTSLGDTIRTYLEDEFKIDCFEKTSNEIVSSTKKSKLLRPYKNNLKEILELIDMVKFAKATSDEAEQNATLQNTHNYIVDVYKAKKKQEEIDELSKQTEA
ncbi:MAG: hypothetical protein R2831_12995 [Chitinophagaceae bacterium]